MQRTASKSYQFYCDFCAGKLPIGKKNLTKTSQQDSWNRNIFAICGNPKKLFLGNDNIFRFLFEGITPRCPHIEHLKNCQHLISTAKNCIATQFAIKLNIPITHSFTPTAVRNGWKHLETCSTGRLYCI